MGLIKLFKKLFDYSGDKMPGFREEPRLDAPTAPNNESFHTESSIYNEVRIYNSSEHSRDDNMNCDLYEGRARFLETKRMRQISFCLFSGEIIEDVVNESGYSTENMEVKKVSFPRPTDLQIQTMIKHDDPIPKNVSRMDISAVIDRIREEDRKAPSYLFDFASKHRVAASYFSGEKFLHNLIWRELPEGKNIGFFILCVDKHKNGKWRPEKFEEFSNMYESLISNQAFSNSISNFYRDGFYGFSQNVGIRTNAYKTAAEKIK